MRMYFNERTINRQTVGPFYLAMLLEHLRCKGIVYEHSRRLFVYVALRSSIRRDATLVGT